MLFINETYQSFFFLFCLTMKKIKIFSKQSKINLLEKSRGIKKTLTSSASDRITTHFTFEAMRKPSRFFSRSQTRKLVLIRVVCGPISLCITLISLTQIGNPNKQKTLPGIWQNITLVMATIGMYGNYPFTSYFWPVIWSSLGNSR